MVNIDTLFKKNKISRIGELETERYANFFESSYKDNLEHSRFNIERFPRWSIISGYYAMHDLTKLIIAKKFRIKIDFNVRNRKLHILICSLYFVFPISEHPKNPMKKQEGFFDVHLTTIQLLRELIKDKELTKHLEEGYKEFLSLANDLEEARKERTKAQYYTGTSFLAEEYKKRAREFYDNVVIVYINKMLALL